MISDAGWIAEARYILEMSPSHREMDALLGAAARITGVDEVFGGALSGGGVWTFLFVLGPLLYLIDSGLNRRISVIFSVSGGPVAAVRASVAFPGGLP